MSLIWVFMKIILVILLDGFDLVIAKKYKSFKDGRFCYAMDAMFSVL